MSNISSIRSAKGVLLGDNGGANPAQGTIIKDNVIDNVSSSSRGAYGVLDWRPRFGKRLFKGVQAPPSSRKKGGSTEGVGQMEPSKWAAWNHHSWAK